MHYVPQEIEFTFPRINYTFGLDQYQILRGTELKTTTRTVESRPHQPITARQHATNVQQIASGQTSRVRHWSVLGCHLHPRNSRLCEAVAARVEQGLAEPQIGQQLSRLN